ncbi:MAG: pyridoxamine 5'-phosphate oxidase family protein [Nitrososphaerales archaeon]
MTDEIKKMFGEGKDVAFIATVDAQGRPNVCCKGSLRVLDDEHLWYIEGTGKKTCNNLRKNPYVAVAIASREKMDGYQVKGKAEILTKGPLYEEAVKISEERARRLGREMTKPKAAIKIKVDEVYSLKPGPTAGEKIC